MLHRSHLIASVAGLALCLPSLAIDTPETEPNELKPLANPATLAPGDSVSGTSTGMSTTVPGIASADTFLIRTGAVAPGIYRYTLTLTSGSVGHTGTLRGLSQTTVGVITPGTDSTLETSFSQPDTSRLNAWYGFGHEEQVYYRVTGGTATTAPYTATLGRTAITPTPLGTDLDPGQYTIRVTGAGSTTDPEIWVYDAATLMPVPDFNNDDTFGGGLQSTLTRNFPAGQYILCLSDYNLANNLPSPADENGRGEIVTDFPGVLVSGDREATFTSNVEIHSGGIAGPIVATGSYAQDADFGVRFVSFTVGTPGPTCDPDFNCDGNPDQDDVACLINVVAGNPGCECQDPDFNQDGNVDQDDVAALINVVAGGNCP